MDTRRNCNLYLVFLSRLLSVKKEKNSPKSKYYKSEESYGYENENWTMDTRI